MNQNALLTLHAATFLHPGAGQSTGLVDLPVQRERHTGFPMLASSGLKGSLRDKAEQAWGRDNSDVAVIFGSPEAGGSDSCAGALIVSDARILAFPVRSLQKVFVWATCPMVLDRLRRDTELAGLNVDVPEVPFISKGQALIPEGMQNPLVLEEIRLEQVAGQQSSFSLSGICPEVDDGRLVVISDEDFQHFVRHATQVNARIKLNERKTTTGDGGNLWYEETLPPETVMYALLMSRPPRSRNGDLSNASDVLEKVRSLFPENNRFLQVGGNETVGQGWCRVGWHGGVR